MTAVDATALMVAEYEFVLARVTAEARRVYPRCWGLSSNALAMYALGRGPRPRVPGTSTSRGFWVGEECGSFDCPADEDDLGACELTYAMAPPHLQERMLPVLVEFRGWVRERRNRHGAVEARP